MTHAVTLGGGFLSTNHAVKCAHPHLSGVHTVVRLFLSTRCLYLPKCLLPLIPWFLLHHPFWRLFPVTSLLTQLLFLLHLTETTLRRKCFLVPFAVLTIQDTTSATYVSNPFSCPSTLLRGKWLGSADELDHVSAYNFFNHPILEMVVKRNAIAFFAVLAIWCKWNHIYILNQSSLRHSFVTSRLRSTQNHRIKAMTSMPLKKTFPGYRGALQDPVNVDVWVSPLL